MDRIVCIFFVMQNHATCIYRGCPCTGQPIILYRGKHTHCLFLSRPNLAAIAWQAKFSSICRLNNWSKACEDALNKQIALEYAASHQYHLMFSYFDQDNIGLDKIALLMEENSLEERTHAHELIQYQNSRGGRVQLNLNDQPSLDYLNASKENDVLASFNKALDMEQTVYLSLKNLHDIATSENDAQFADHLETLLLEQINAINLLSKRIGQLIRVGPKGHDVWHFATAGL